MSDVLHQLDAFTTPGTLLKSAREARGMSAREAADRLHLMPDYVAILERDDYQALRNPAFAKGYLKAYCRMLGLEENGVLSLYDDILAEGGSPEQPRIVTVPLQLQSTGLGVVIGVGVLLVLVMVFWWWRATPDVAVAGEAGGEPRGLPDTVQYEPELIRAGENR